MSDDVSLLERYARKHSIAVPEYKEISVTGQAHKRTFEIACKFVGLEVATTAGSKKDAKKACASLMVAKMREKDYLSEDNTDSADPVSSLQQLLQKHGHPLPEYDDKGTKGLDHCKRFVICVTARNNKGEVLGHPCDGEASSKKGAKKLAASQLLSMLSCMEDDQLLASPFSTLPQASSMASKKSGESTLNDKMASMTLFDQFNASPPDSTRKCPDQQSTGKFPTSSIDPFVMFDAMGVEPVYNCFLGDGDQCLCLVSLDHMGQQLVGCGVGSHSNIAKQNAAVNLLTNLTVLTQ